MSYRRTRPKKWNHHCPSVSWIDLIVENGLLLPSILLGDQKWPLDWLQLNWSRVTKIWIINLRTMKLSWQLSPAQKMITGRSFWEEATAVRSSWAEWPTTAHWHQVGAVLTAWPSLNEFWLIVIEEDSRIECRFRVIRTGHLSQPLVEERKMDATF